MNFTIIKVIWFFITFSILLFKLLSCDEVPRTYEINVGGYIVKVLETVRDQMIGYYWDSSAIKCRSSHTTLVG